MTANCQFCSTQIFGREVPEDTPENAYRKLTHEVVEHMLIHHRDDAGAEIMQIEAAAGAAIAMRYVASDDAAVDQWRAALGRALMQAFDPAPNGPVRTNPEVIPAP